jgi:hypothetical protein
MMNQIDLQRVMSVYSGVNGACCCGCKGKHTFASAHVETGSRHRGYEVTSDQVNDRTVKRIVNKVNKEISGGNAEYDGDLVAAVVGNRQYVVYFLPTE